jgi:hypothetical protein
MHHNNPLPQVTETRTATKDTMKCANDDTKVDGTQCMIMNKTHCINKWCGTRVTHGYFYPYPYPYPRDTQTCSAGPGSRAFFMGNGYGSCDPWGVFFLILLTYTLLAAIPATSMDSTFVRPHGYDNHMTGEMRLGP